MPQTMTAVYKHKEKHLEMKVGNARFLSLWKQKEAMEFFHNFTNRLWAAMEQ